MASPLRRGWKHKHVIFLFQFLLLRCLCSFCDYIEPEDHIYLLSNYPDTLTLSSTTYAGTFFVNLCSNSTICAPTPHSGTCFTSQYGYTTDVLLATSSTYAWRTASDGSIWLNTNGGPGSCSPDPCELYYKMTYTCDPKIAISDIPVANLPSEFNVVGSNSYGLTLGIPCADNVFIDNPTITTYPNNTSFTFNWNSPSECVPCFGSGVVALHLNDSVIATTNYADERYTYFTNISVGSWGTVYRMSVHYSDAASTSQILSSVDILLGCTSDASCSYAGTCNASVCKCNNATGLACETCLPGFEGHPNCKATKNCTDCCELNSSELCRPSTGPCDIPEYCDGQTSKCPIDLGQPSDFVCRSNASECDIPRVCGASTSACALNIVKVRDSCGICGGDNTSCTSNGKCGDLYCNEDIGESCSTCILDCGYCKQDCANVKCVHGSCTAGVCICLPYWTGTFCDASSLPMIMNASLSDTLGKGVSLRNTYTLFNVYLSQLYEITSNNSIYKTFPVSNWNFTIRELNQRSSRTFEYFGVTPNKAYISYSCTYYNQTQEIMFGGLNHTVLPNVMNLKLTITNWPFQSLSNKLKICIAHNSNMSLQANEDYNDNNDNNLQAMRYSSSEGSMYITYLPYIVLDGFTRPVEVTAEDATQSVCLTVPHFWSSVSIDPDFTTLVTPDGKQQKKSLTWIVYVVVPVVVVAFLVCGVMFYFQKKHEAEVARQLKPKLPEDAEFDVNGEAKPGVKFGITELGSGYSKSNLHE